MKEFDIKSHGETRQEAKEMLEEIISDYNKQEKVIKIIHGYGSSGVGGVIKQMVRKSLQSKLNQNQIKAFIPGEAIKGFMGYSEIIDKYKNLIINDSDYHKSNDGITYVIFNG